MEIVEIELTCGGPRCGEIWVHEKIRGMPGRNPGTNPDHPECKREKENGGRARRRAQARAEGVPESERSREDWKPPKLSGVTAAELKEMRESQHGHDERTRRDPFASARALLEFQALEGAPCADDHFFLTRKDSERFRYISKSKVPEVKEWLSRNEMPSEEDPGVPGPRFGCVDDHHWAGTIIGSTTVPWHGFGEAFQPVNERPREGRADPWASDPEEWAEDNVDKLCERIDRERGWRGWHGVGPVWGPSPLGPVRQRKVD